MWYEIAEEILHKTDRNYLLDEDGSDFGKFMGRVSDNAFAVGGSIESRQIVALAIELWVEIKTAPEEP